jgi:hypothetical protein
MSKNEQKIIKALIAKNYPNELISVSWNPINRGIEMGGMEGGWMVEIKNYDYVFGFNINDVIENIDRMNNFDPEFL